MAGQQRLVILHDLHRHAKLACDEIRVPIVQTFGARVSGGVHEPQRGLPACAPFRFRPDDPASRITVPDVHELVAERAELLMVE